MTVDTNSVYVQVLLRAHKIMLARGASPENLLQDTGLVSADLLNPYGIIRRDQAVQYYRNLVQVAPPGIGLEVGRNSALSDFGSTGYSILAAATGEQAVRKSRQRYELYYQHVGWDVTVSDEAISHQLTADESPQDLRIFLLDRALAMIQAHAEELAGPSCVPDELLLSYSDGGYADRYKTIFGCQVCFDRPLTIIRYPGRYSRYPISSHDPEVLVVLDKVNESLGHRLSSGTDVTSTVKMLLGEKMGFFPSIDIVAERLEMSSRTLSRRLQDAGTSFQLLLDAVRREIAEDRLVNSRMSVQQIANLCGFRDAPNFSQAFKRWNGQAPSEYRKMHR